MKKINVLSKQTAQLIAAGEVVEKPASVLKELLENSIDSGASRIVAEIKNGGIKFIKVSDNGSGIYREDVKNAFLRHATSKLSEPEDLNKICSLGFRGEALASICSVSKVEVITKSKEETQGTRFYIDAGASGDIEEFGCADGTSIIVRDIFYNTPARMKFLKKDVSEANACALVIDKLALSHPEISFKFIRDGKEALYTPGDKKVSSAIYSVYGKEFFDGMIPVNYELNNIKITGFISKPICSKSTRSMQSFFVNNRYVKTKICSEALEEGFKNSVMVGKFPYCVLYIDVPPEMIDVNVHPAKTEIKFSDEKSLFEAVYYAVKSALMVQNKATEFGRENTFKMRDSAPVFKTNVQIPIVKSFKNIPNDDFDIKNKVSASQILKKIKTEKPSVFSYNENYRKENNPIVENKPEVFFKEKRIEKLTGSSANTFKSISNSENILSDKKPLNFEHPCKPISFFEDKHMKKINVIGEIFNCYIIAECEKEMILIDKHAAHERIIFEKLKNSTNPNESQVLLEPRVITLEKDEYSAIIQNLSMLSEVGYEIGDFGNGSVIVRSIPMYMNLNDISDSVLEIADYILSNRKSLDTKKLDWLYHNIACRCAVKGGKQSSREEIISLVETLLNNPDIKYCPHGRPIFVPLTQKFIEKQFGRA